MRVLGVDVSHWQGPIDWRTLYDGGARFATAKVSQGDYLLDPSRATHLTGAHGAGLVTGAFFWDDPICAPVRVADYAVKACVGLPVDYLLPDMEQWWPDWPAYRTWRAGTGPRPAPFTKDALAEHSVAVWNLVARKFGGPVFPYTSTTFVRSYMPAFAARMAGNKAYLAQYPKQPQHVLSLTWAQVAERLATLAAWKPDLPEPTVDCRLVQWCGDRIIVPGYKGVIDLDYFEGTEAEMATWLGGTAVVPAPAPVPALTETEKVGRLWAAHPGLHGG